MLITSRSIALLQAQCTPMGQ